MHINSQRGKIKPLQAARLLRLAIDKRASLGDRAWAINTLLETRESMIHEDIVKAMKSLTDKDKRLKVSLRKCLLRISTEPEQLSSHTGPARHLRRST